MIKPITMGALMGLMMLWIAHGLLTKNSTMAGPALGAFIAAHVVVLAIILASGLFAARLSHKLRDKLSRIHRPSLKHIALMLTAATGTAFAAHLAIHGGLA